MKSSNFLIQKQNKQSHPKDHLQYTKTKYRKVCNNKKVKVRSRRNPIVKIMVFNKFTTVKTKQIK